MPWRISFPARAFLLIHFFSSRRRHTRYIGDWEFRRVLFRSLFASEIFLASPGGNHRQILHHRDAAQRILFDRTKLHCPSAFAQRFFFPSKTGVNQTKDAERSEERRVGKERKARRTT